MNALLKLDAAMLTMASPELLEFVNEARAEFGESPVRHNDFVSRCRDELDGEPYETFVESAKGRAPAFEAIRMTPDQCKLVAMRESKGVRRRVLARLNALEAKVAAPAPEALSRMEILQLALAAEQEKIAIAAERDHAIATKAQIGSRREATAMATAASARREADKLRAELGRSQQHATVIAVQRAQGKTYPANAYVALRRVCKKSGIAPVDVVDPRYGSVKAWPACAWREAYGVELGDLFPCAEVA